MINVEGPRGRDVDGKRTWKALASHTVDGLLSCTRLAPWLVGEQVYFSLSSVYRAPRRKYVSEVTGLVVYSRDELQFLNCVCVDIDLAHNGEQFDFDAQVQQVLDFTMTAGLPYPSMVSDSGRGMWLFWLLKDRLNPGPPTAHNNLQVSHSRLLSAAVAAYHKFNSPKITEMLKVTAEEREHLSFWLKPATRSKQAEIDHRRAILAAEIALSGPLSIRKAVFVLGQRGVTSSRSRIGADLKYLRGAGVTWRGAQAPPPGPPLSPGGSVAAPWPRLKARTQNPKNPACL